MSDDPTIDAARSYIRSGLQCLLLEGIADAGGCTCWKGLDCGSPGKHPHGRTWQVASTEADVERLWAGSTPYNIGIVLGPAGRVVDVECDDEAAAEELRRLGVAGIKTPTWSSGRGQHRLFRWQDDLPPTAVAKPLGIECRLGAGGRQAQSVAPPSRHHSGRSYAWEPGLALGQVDIAPIPDALLGLIQQEANRPPAPPPSDREQRASTAILRAPVAEGGRNGALHRSACLLARAVPPGDDAGEQALLEVLRGVNDRRCRPPLPDAEVLAIFRSAVRFRREQIATAALLPGVAAEIDGGRTIYRPDGLEATILRGDPSRFQLRCDAWRRFNGSGEVAVEAAAWADSKRLKPLLVGALPGLPIDRWPGDFDRLWNGSAPVAATSRREAREPVPGLRTQLEQAALEAGRVVDVIDPAEHHGRRVAAWVIDQVDRGGQLPHILRDHEDVSIADVVAATCPASGGQACCWVPGGPLVVNWTRLWRSIEMIHRVDRGDQAKAVAVIREVLGRPLEPLRLQHHNQRFTYRLLEPSDVERLRDYASGATAATPASSYAYSTPTRALENRNGVAAVADREETTV